VIWERFIGRGGKAGETVAEFATRRLGINAFERLIDPFVSGIFAGDPKQLLVAAAFPRLVELENTYGSLIKASAALKKERKDSHSNAAGPSGRLTSFRDGLCVLIDALGKSLGESVQTNAPVEDLREVDGKWVVGCRDGRTFSDVDAVILAIPAYAAARVLAPLGDGLSTPLSDIPYAPVAVVALGYDQRNIEHDLNGFGFLVPTRESRQILGCLWTSSIFPGCRAPDGHVLLRTIVGGAKQPEIALRSDEELIELVRGELGPILKLDSMPSYVRIIRYRSAIPQYVEGHLDRVAQLERELQAHAGLFVTGNSLRGVGINDCTREAISIAEAVIPA